MADDKGRRTTGSMPAVFPGGSSSRPGSSSSATMPRVGLSSGNLPRVEVPRDTRIPLAAQVRLQYASILDFHETQSVNISRTGMFVACDSPAPIGTLVDFEFCLEDGLSLLKGKGEVVRVTQNPMSGMGVRFRQLDEESRRCISRIVEINEQEGRSSRISLDFGESGSVASRQPAGLVNSPWPTPTPVPVPAPAPISRSAHPLHGATRVQPGLTVVGRDLQVRLTPLTAGYFTNNPLLNIRLGGFVIPIEEEVSLGASFDVTIVDNDGISLFNGKGKVVAQHEHRIGIRLGDVAKPILARLQAEIARLSPGGK